MVGKRKRGGCFQRMEVIGISFFAWLVVQINYTDAVYKTFPNIKGGKARGATFFEAAGQLL